MSQGQRTSGRRGMQGSYGAGRRMAGLCVVLMGVFALMTVLVLAGSGNNTRLDGSQSYPDAGPLPDMIAPGGASASPAHGAKHLTPSQSAQSGAAGSLETLPGSVATLAGASTVGSVSQAGHAATRTSSVATSSSSRSKASTGRAVVTSTGGGKSTGSAGKSGGSSGSKGSGGGGSTPGKPGGSGSAGGSKPGGSTGGSGGGGSTPGKPGGSGSAGGSKPGGSTGGSGSSGGSTSAHTSSSDRAALLKQLEQQYLAWRAHMLAHEKELEQRLAEQRAQHVSPPPARDVHTSHPTPPGHANGRESNGHGRHGH